MKYSACTGCFGPGNLEKIIPHIAELGFDAVELTVAVHCPVTTSAADRAQIRGWIAQAGLVCNAVHFIFEGAVRLASTDPAVLDHAVAYLKAVTNVCADVGGKVVIVGGGGVRAIAADQQLATVEPYMVDAIRRAADHAGTRGVKLAIEPLNRFETNYLRTVAQAAHFAALTAHPQVGFICDTFHMNIEEGAIGAAVRPYAASLLDVHLADSNRRVPGEGHFAFRELFDVLRETGYDGYCTFESICIAPEQKFLGSFADASAEMARGLAYVRSLTDPVTPAPDCPAR